MSVRPCFAGFLALALLGATSMAATAEGPTLVMGRVVLQQIDRHGAKNTILLRGVKVSLSVYGNKEEGRQRFKIKDTQTYTSTTDEHGVFIFANIPQQAFFSVRKVDHALCSQIKRPDGLSPCPVQDALHSFLEGKAFFLKEIGYKIDDKVGKYCFGETG